jgi:isopenicillin N synthase-like dioxygenase
VWIPVPPRPGALVVNLGSELERWSNGRFKATLHCVVNDSELAELHNPYLSL